MFSSNATFENFILGGTLVFGLLVIAIILFLFQIQKKNQRYMLEKQHLKIQYEQALLQTQLEIQEQTLKNVSEEIHDNIGQVLSLVKLNLNTFPGNMDEVVQNKITDTEALLSKAINDLRDLSQSMHGNSIAALGLQPALEQELKHIEKTGRFKTHLQASGTAFSPGVQKEMVLFRIAQEALNNAVKHSCAKNIHIDLAYLPSSIILQVTDDGKGFENTDKKQTGIGLTSMQNRAALIGGIFSLHSTREQGVSVSVEIKTA